MVDMFKQKLDSLDCFTLDFYAERKLRFSDLNHLFQKYDFMTPFLCIFKESTLPVSKTESRKVFSAVQIKKHLIVGRYCVAVLRVPSVAVAYCFHQGTFFPIGQYIS